MNWTLPASLPTFPPQNRPPPPSPVAAPTSPSAAVTGFVSAQASGDFDTAWALLSSADRASTSSAAGWRARQRQLPTFVSVALDGPTITTTPTTTPATTAQPATSATTAPRTTPSTGSAVTLTGVVTFQPALDEVRGLTPATAKATWVLSSEDSGWRVRYSDSTFQAQLPTDTNGAATAVVKWAAERRKPGCRRPAEEWSGGLVGVPGLADRLCTAKGEPTVGASTALDQAMDTAPVVAAFGPEALTWARLVPVRSPVPMRAVVAPVGDRWLVVGVLMP
jgi:hypothetical protein